MIDQFIIFSKTGILLWSFTEHEPKGDPVNGLIRDVLLQERAGLNTHTKDDYTLHWTLENKLDLVFVVVYGKLLTLLYIEDLLEKVKAVGIDDRPPTNIIRCSQAFVSQFSSKIVNPTGKPLPFEETFEKVRYAAEFGAMKKKIDKKKPTAMRTKKGKKAGAEEDPADAEQDEPDEDEFEKLKRLQFAKKKGGSMGAFKKSPKKSPKNKSPKKEKTSWQTGQQKVTKEAMEALDKSSKEDIGDGPNPALEAMRKQFIDENPDDDNDLWSDDEDGDNKPEQASWFGKSSIGGFFSKITGNQVLDREAVMPAVTAVKEKLIGKNVAAEVAENICESLCTALVGQKCDSFTRVSTKVQQALEESLTRILTPKKSTDVLRAVRAKKSQGKPFSIIFVGVNGVGKSTSLSKVCYYLKSKGCKMLIAACDTFRSGAVEQLRTHADCLDVDLFERGYAKDPATVAGAAISHAEENGYDCVLVDTAGRMQNNEPLMRALSKLVTANEPDMVLFVGEALVGNDGVDQLQLFNQALIDYSPLPQPHTIDGMVLTKFDTVDDKVGAAVSMVYKTGQPVMFVGTGQKYNHLKQLNVRSVIKQLFA